MEGLGTRTALVLGVLTALLTVTPAAQAAFPGDVGKIAFHSNRDGNFEIYTMNANGSTQVRLTNNAALDVSPTWSPDGTKIAFTSQRDGNNEIYTMNADGSGQTRRTNNAVDDVTPSWSADGTKLLFSTNRDGNFEVYSMNADGTSPVRITNNAALDGQPVMSANGDKIAFLTNRDGNFEVYLMNPNGSSPQNLSQRAGSDSEPDWSTLGIEVVMEAVEGSDPGNIRRWFGGSFSNIGTVGLSGSIETGPAFAPKFNSDTIAIATTRDDPNPLTCSPCNYEIYTMNGTNGTGLSRNTVNSAVDQAPDWQPVVKQYARPQAAPVRRISLVPAFQQCGSPNVNSAPKSNQNLLSCVPAKPASNYLTIGSPEANGAPANATGIVKMKVFCNGGATGEGPPCSTTAGDQLDAQVTMSQTDVRCQGASGSCPSGALSDYAGNLMLEFSMRTTDRTSGGFGAGTIVEQTVRVPVLCTAVPTGNVGSTCSVTTSLEAAIGGASPTTNITEGKRSIWEVLSTKVFDGGADGVASTNGDNTQFLSDGLFFP